MSDENEMSDALQAQFETQSHTNEDTLAIFKPKVVKDDSFIISFDEKLDFPPGLQEEFRIAVCKLLEKKDKEIKQLNREVDKLEVKYNGSLTYNESEDLKTEMNKAIYLRHAIERELEKRNLVAIQYEPTSGVVRPFDIRIERIPVWTRIKKFLAKLVPFEIRRKEVKSDS